MKHEDVIDSPAVLLQGCRVAVLQLYLAGIITDAEREDLAQRTEDVIQKFVKEKSQ